MKQNLIYILAASALLMLSGCAREVGTEQPRQELRVVAGVDDAVGVAPSRAGYTTADAPAEFGLSIFGYNNLLMTNNGTDWTVSGQTVMWQAQADESVEVAAYAPYLTTLAANSTLSATVPSDQTTADKLKATDYLAVHTVGIGTDNTRDAYIDNGRLHLKLYHKLSKLNVAIAFKQDFTPAEDGTPTVSNVKLQLGAITNNFTLNIKESTVLEGRVENGTTTKTTGGVDMFGSSATAFEGIFVPQTAALALSLTFDYGTEKGLRYTATLAETEFVSGSSYKLTLNVSRATMTVSQIIVADWNDEAVDGGEMTDPSDIEAIKDTEINDVAEFWAFVAKSVNRDFEGETWTLATDLDLTAEGNNAPSGVGLPVGGYLFDYIENKVNLSAKYFKGTFDGQNHTITTPTTLFGVVGDFGNPQSQLGVVKNLKVKLKYVGESITQQSDVCLGAIAGYNYGEISNVDAEIDYENRGITNGTYVFGGIVGNSSGPISNVSVKGSIQIYVSCEYTGGVVGYSVGEITNATVSNLTLTALESDRVGGIVGRNYSSSSVKGCTVGGNTTITAKSNVGGIAGYNMSSVKGCSVGSDTSVSAVKNAGGIVGRGYKDALIEGCSFAGTVSVTDDNVGGICGYFKGTAMICSSTGEVKMAEGAISNNCIGGVCGYMKSNEDDGVASLLGCYSTSTITVLDNPKTEEVDEEGTTKTYVNATGGVVGFSKGASAGRSEDGLDYRSQILSCFSSYNVESATTPYSGIVCGFCAKDFDTTLGEDYTITTGSGYAATMTATEYSAMNAAAATSEYQFDTTSGAIVKK